MKILKDKYGIFIAIKKDDIKNAELKNAIIQIYKNKKGEIVALDILFEDNQDL